MIAVQTFFAERRQITQREVVASLEHLQQLLWVSIVRRRLRRAAMSLAKLTVLAGLCS